MVRDASPQECDVVAGLLDAAYAEHAAHFPPEIWVSYRREIAAVAERAGAGELLVTVRGGVLEGTATFYADGRMDGHAWPPGVGSLRLLAVHPRARTGGIGRALVRECVARARQAGCSDLGLHTAPFMQAANRLYADLGFVRTPALDFDAQLRYAGETAGGARVRLAGQAFLLPLGPTGAAA